MMTLSAEFPMTVTMPCVSRAVHCGSHPPRSRRRTRHDVLQMLVGADPARFAHFPKRRVVRQPARRRSHV